MVAIANTALLTCIAMHLHLQKIILDLDPASSCNVMFCYSLFKYYKNLFYVVLYLYLGYWGIVLVVKDEEVIVAYEIPIKLAM